MTWYVYKLQINSLHPTCITNLISLKGVAVHFALQLSCRWNLKHVITHTGGIFESWSSFHFCEGCCIQSSYYESSSGKCSMSIARRRRGARSLKFCWYSKPTQNGAALCRNRSVACVRLIASIGNVRLMYDEFDFAWWMTVMFFCRFCKIQR